MNVPMPTMGDANVVYNDSAPRPFFVTVKSANGQDFSVAIVPEISERMYDDGRSGGAVVPGQGQANATLFASAISVSERVRAMGFDPIAAVRALPMLLECLTTIRDDCGYPPAGQAEVALSAARTREVKP